MIKCCVCNKEVTSNSFRYITEYELDNPEKIDLKGCF